MKKIFIIAFSILFIAGGLWAESKPKIPGEKIDKAEENTREGKEKPVSPLMVNSVDIAFVNYYPMGEYRDFSDVNLGAAFQVNLQLFGIKPLRVFTSLMAAENITNSERLEQLTDLGLSVGAGWRFNIGFIPLLEGLSLTPQYSYGCLFHIGYGDYNQTGKKDDHVFSDQYMTLECEIAYDLSLHGIVLLGKKIEVFITPGYILFAEENTVGHEIGYKLGLRTNF